MLRQIKPLLLAFCLIGIAVEASAETTASTDQNESAWNSDVWVTSICSLGESRRFVATTANGLLLRPSDVVVVGSGDVTSMDKLYSHPAASWCSCVTPDGKHVGSIDYRGNLIVHDTALSETLVFEKAMERWCQTVSNSPDGTALLAGNDAGKLFAWDLAKNEVAKSVQLSDQSITDIALKDDQIAVSDGSGKVHLITWPSLESVGTISISDEAAWCVEFVPQANQPQINQIVVGSADRKLYLADAAADSKAVVIGKGKDWLTQIAISANGTIAAGQPKGDVHFFNPSPDSIEPTSTVATDSGVWALHWASPSELLIGTRKNGLMIASQSWSTGSTSLASIPPAAEATQAPSEDSVTEASEESATAKKEASKGETKGSSKDE